jgi:hypothetical protein
VAEAIFDPGCAHGVYRAIAVTAYLKLALKLLLATQPPIKTLLKQKVQKLVTTPQWGEAAVIKAMKEVQRDLDYFRRRAEETTCEPLDLIAGTRVYRSESQSDGTSVRILFYCRS